MSIVTQVLGIGAKCARPVLAEVPVKKMVNPILQKAQEAYGNVVLKGVRGDIAVLTRGTESSPTIFARIGKDGTFHNLKERFLYKPFKLDDGRILRRRLDLSMTKTLDGQQVQKTVYNDRLYNLGKLINKEKKVVYDAPNACNGHYTERLPYIGRASYDISNGTYSKYIEATASPGRRIAGEKGSLLYKNGHLTIPKTEHWSYNPNLQGDDIRRKVGTAGFLDPKFM